MDKLDASSLDTLSLDAPSFSAGPFCRQLLSTRPLGDLLSRSDALHSQALQLDSTMQTLVYENYAKFITATDAVRGIGRDIADAGPSLARLRADMAAAKDRSRAIDDKLRPSRAQVAAKLKVRRNLDRLSSLLSLPQDLKKMLDGREFVRAAEHWRAGGPILDRHKKSFGSLEGIEGAARK
ncbi:hypothetical protein TeGR_g7424, partial [Tetraparma gracilis]